MLTSPQTNAPRQRRLPIGLLAILAVAMLAAACTSESSTEAGPAVAALPSEDEQAAGSDSENEDGDSSSDDGASEDGEVSAEEAEAAQLRYDQCMADNGVDMDELFGDQEGEDGAVVEFDADEGFENFEQAQEACDPILEDVFGDFELSPEDEAEFADMEARFNQCMADEGFAMSDNGGEGIGFELDADTDQDEIEAAFDKCDEIFEEFNLSGADSATAEGEG